jgi:hypothetical protein
VEFLTPVARTGWRLQPSRSPQHRRRWPTLLFCRQLTVAAHHPSGLQGIQRHPALFRGDPAHPVVGLECPDGDDIRHDRFDPFGRPDGLRAELPDLFRRLGDYVDQILHGTKSGDIPVEQPTKFTFTHRQGFWPSLLHRRCSRAPTRSSSRYETRQITDPIPCGRRGCRNGPMGALGGSSLAERKK